MGPIAGHAKGRPVLRGRNAECLVLDEVLAGTQAAHGQVLVISGEPGVGKTALLDYVERRALGCRVVRTTSVESEVELAFAGLHQLCVPILHHLSLIHI